MSSSMPLYHVPRTVWAGRQLWTVLAAVVAVLHIVSDQVQLVLSCVFTNIAEQLSAGYRIIGKGGETVRALQSYSGAMIQVTAGQVIT